MKIKELTFEDKTTKWKLEKTKFSDLTLLVGISGVGVAIAMEQKFTILLKSA